MHPYLSSNLAVLLRRRHHLVRSCLLTRPLPEACLRSVLSRLLSGQKIPHLRTSILCQWKPESCPQVLRVRLLSVTLPARFLDPVLSQLRAVASGPFGLTIWPAPITPSFLISAAAAFCLTLEPKFRVLRCNACRAGRDMAHLWSAEAAMVEKGCKCSGSLSFLEGELKTKMCCKRSSHSSSHAEVHFRF